MTGTNAAGGWPSLAGLLTDTAAEVALLGAPLRRSSVTAGRCDRAPAAIRRTLARLSTYDVARETELNMAVTDAGDLDIAALDAADAFTPIRDALASLLERHSLVLMLGGNNAVTRPGVHALGPLDGTALITLDAHFDLRDTAGGLGNGNPVRALLDDGLPGRNLVQIGLAPYANTAAMHATARDAGSGVVTVDDVARLGIDAVVAAALDRVADGCDHVYVDFDIDVIDRAQCPGAPGARPGGIDASTFFEATRLLLAHPKVRGVDLVEFDPALDVADITALTAARWVAEALAGFAARTG
ncbi:MAG: agmatinase family protein [Pseudomonadota bacterium]